MPERVGGAGASVLVIGYWSSWDILLNRHHQDVASNGGVLFARLPHVDVALRQHLKAFVYAEI